MNSDHKRNPYRTVGWTLLFLTLATFLIYNFFPLGSGPMPSEEMQWREAEQRAHQGLDSI
jgi:hypothetical protein